MALPTFTAGSAESGWSRSRGGRVTCAASSTAIPIPIRSPYSVPLVIRLGHPRDSERQRDPGRSSRSIRTRQPPLSGASGRRLCAWTFAGDELSRHRVPAMRLEMAVACIFQMPGASAHRQPALDQSAVPGNLPRALTNDSLSGDETSVCVLSRGGVRRSAQQSSGRRTSHRRQDGYPRCELHGR